MKVLRYINKWLHKSWDTNVNMPTGIDSHKWNSKMEILGCLSSRSHHIIRHKGADS
ncbi:MAG: hypothetical protein RQ760_04475 [Sedimentisphaerales bacterium]|nr:hypothetical protein [Sedimentisphaerales bacterium]